MSKYYTEASDEGQDWRTDEEEQYYRELLNQIEVQMSMIQDRETEDEYLEVDEDD